MCNVSAQRKMEYLDRGLVAVETSGGVFLSWRILGYEWEGVTYNLYRDGSKVNSEPLSVSNYTDASGTSTSEYYVKAIVNGEEQEAGKTITPLANQYLEIAVKERPVSTAVQYEINDATAADLDGDGEYEIIIKRLYQDWTVEAPYYTYFEAYKLNGDLLWEINVGPNIMSSSGVEINIAAFDLDEDGKAEVFLRTSEGTIFGDGSKIGDTDNDGITNYRYSVYQSANMQYITRGPEFLSLVDGETGAELDRVDFIPRYPGTNYPTDNQYSAYWGDSYGHRSNKFFFGAPYLDGKHPSIFIGRGIYTRTMMAAYDVVNKELVQRWSFSTDDYPTYYGQGNHNYTIADVDMDGRDEIVYGSMTVDDNGEGLYSTQLGHGDALHVGDLDPYRKGTEVFKCLEDSPDFGTALYDGATGQILIHDILGRDCGRCMAANISDEVKGATLWGSTTMFSASTREAVSVQGNSVNFRIYWDGDLLEELLDHNWNGAGGEGVIQKSGSGNIFTATGTNSCNWTKGTPTLQADLFGDWREEVIWRTSDDSKFRIYTTVDPTIYRNYTLMHDHQYRQAICWQMCGYNQPPHVSYFLGKAEGITVPPPPTLSNEKLVYDGSGVWDKTTTNWTSDDVATSYADGAKVLFDLTTGLSDVPQVVDDISLAISEDVAPASVAINSPGNYYIDGSQGKMTGTMMLTKQGMGVCSITGEHDYTGNTEVWAGKLNMDGALSQSDVWVNMHAAFGGKGVFGKGISLRYGSELYVGEADAAGKLSIGESLETEENTSIVMDIYGVSDVENDSLVVTGDINLADATIIQIVPHIVGDAGLSEGEYLLMSCGGTFTVDMDKLVLQGVGNVSASLELRNNDLYLVVNDMRAAATVYWSGSESNQWDFNTTKNFINNSVEDVFASGDEVIFDDNAAVKSISLVDEVTPGSILFNNTSDYTLSGSGSISGEAGLTKKGEGKVTISNVNSFTGTVLVEEGTLQVPSMPNEIDGNSALGAPSSNADLLQLDGGTLLISSATTSDRALKVGDNGGTISNNYEVKWNGRIQGGSLSKAGLGELVLTTANLNSELVIESGAVRLFNEDAYPGVKVILKRGKLYCYDNYYTYSKASYAIEVPEGYVGTMYLDGRCEYANKLTGGGTLNLSIPWIRSDFTGNWSGFEGTINLMGSSWFRDYSTTGYAKAKFYLPTGTSYTAMSGQVVRFGSLGGNGSIGGASSWYIGQRDENFSYNGIVESGNIIKQGTGKATFTGATSISSTVNVTEGEMYFNISDDGSSNFGNATVQSGATLSGNATFSGAINVRSGAILSPGNTSATGKLQARQVVLNETSDFVVGVRPGSNKANKVEASASFAANGTLTFNNITSEDYEVGQMFEIVAAPTISGSFTAVVPETPGDGLAWDFTDFTNNGTVKVANATGISTPNYVEELNIFPNPTNGNVRFCIEKGLGSAQVRIETLSGKVLRVQNVAEVSDLSLNMQAYGAGIYLIRFEFENKVMVGKVIVR